VRYPVLAAAAGLACAAPGLAQSWSTIANFSPTANPSGVWSYGTRSTPTGIPMSLYDLPFNVTSHLQGWTGSQFPAAGPMLGANMTVVPQSIPGTNTVVPPCTTWATPAADRYSFFRFTAPNVAQYSVSALFQRIDPDSPGPANAVVSVAAAIVYNQAVPANGDLASFLGGPYLLNAGQFIDIMIGPGAGGGGATRAEAFIDQGPPRCEANCDGSTTPPFLNVNDFICFQGKFAARDPDANCVHATQPPLFTVHDFVCFQSRFAAGCSAP